MFHPSGHHPSNSNRDERNFYAKVFAGFLFADRHPAREAVLFEAGNRLTGAVDIPVLANLPRPEGELFISFDNHVHDHVAGETQSAEFADVAVWGDRGFVTVEAKVAVDWKLDKDIVDEINNAALVAKSRSLRHLGHALVISERKWEAVRGPKAVGHSRSTWNRFLAWLPLAPVPVVILTWSDLAKRAAETCGEDGRRFAEWAAVQAEINARKVEAMPPAGGAA